MTERNGLDAIRSLDYVILLCEDLEEMTEFYTKIFGFQVEDEQDQRWIGFRVGNLFLGLRPRGRSYDGPKIKHESASVQLSFRIPPDDVDTAFELLTAKGVNVIEGPTNQDWPHRTLFFRDPENNIIEIFADISVGDCVSKSSGLHQIKE